MDNRIKEAVRQAIEAATFAQVEHAAEMMNDTIKKYANEPYALAGLAYTAGMAEGLQMQAESADVKDTGAEIFEDDLIPYSDWMESNKGDWPQMLSVSKLMVLLDTAERYIVFRTAARLVNIGMTEEERAMIVEQTKGVITA